MTQPTRSALEILAQFVSVVGSVPDHDTSFVCQACLGPVNGFQQCYGCNKLFTVAPQGLRGRVVPMTIVTNPSLWYHRFTGYKNGHATFHLHLSALSAAYLNSHETDLTRLLGGSVTRIVVVPSTHGKPFSTLPLAGVVRQSVRFRDLLVDAVNHIPGTEIGRQEYNPSALHVRADLVRDQRVVVIEDLWVSGAKAVSTAGAVLQAGAVCVAILPLGREVRPSALYCPGEYVAKTKGPFDIRHWPRE